MAVLHTYVRKKPFAKYTFHILQFIIRGASSCILLHLDDITALSKGVMEGECVSDSIESYKGLPQAGMKRGAQGDIEPSLQLSHQLFLGEL